ncbi:hypothetical protein IV203_036803 [Nitzschia inconspicua]|uniref:Uncharacterized protein n=1 Tax=Nitzschia inconspicua TaxID=303405 RepID=A0A9K3LGI9_9STRA|nr:hypothetical protein IV203_036803 [Nitzschia inconspicua]
MTELDDFAEILPSATSETAESTGSNGISKSKARNLRRKRAKQRLKSTAGETEERSATPIDETMVDASKDPGKENKQESLHNVSEKRPKKKRSRKTKSKSHTESDDKEEENGRVIPSPAPVLSSPISVESVPQQSSQLNNAEVKPKMEEEEEPSGQKDPIASVTPTTQLTVLEDKSQDEEVHIAHVSLPESRDFVAEKAPDSNCVSPEVSAPSPTPDIEKAPDSNCVGPEVSAPSPTPDIEKAPDSNCVGPEVSAPSPTPDISPPTLSGASAGPSISVKSEPTNDVYYDDNEKSSSGKEKETCECNGCVIS